MANQDFRVKNGLQVGLGASVVGIVTAESFSGSAVGLTSVPSASLTGTISTERLSGTYNIDVTGTMSGDSINVGGGNTGVFAKNDGTLLVSGITTFKDRVIFDSTNSIQVPVGTDEQKDAVGTAVTGQIRYNTTNSQFEGFGPGNDWGSLGGVKDVDGDTYVKAESSPGSDEDALTFFTGGTEKAVIDSDGKVGIGSTQPTSKLSVDGTVNVSGISTFQNNVEIDSTGYLKIPVGLSTDRPTGAGVTLGQIRYNSELSQFEGYGAGNAWGSLGGIKDVDQDTYITAESSAGADEDALTFFTGGTEKAVIDSDGKVGIGSTQPTAKLDVNGTLNVSGISTFHDNVDIADDERLRLGADSGGLHLYHVSNGSVSDIKQNASGSLRIRANHIMFYNKDITSTWIGCSFGAVTLHYNNDIKLKTVSDGIEVRGNATVGTATTGVVARNDGTLNVSGISTFLGDIKLLVDGSSDGSIGGALRIGQQGKLRLRAYGGHSYINNTNFAGFNITSSGPVNIKSSSSEQIATFNPNAGVKLYYDNQKKFETTSTGIKVLNNRVDQSNNENTIRDTAVISGPQNIILDPSPDDVVAIVDGVISSAGVSTITGITTTNIAVGNNIQEIDGIISAGTTVTSVGISSLTISNVSLGATDNQNFTFLDLTPTGIVRIKGDLYVDGTTTEINSTTLTIDDLNVVVASGATNGLTADGAGLTVDGANAYLKYNYNAGTNENWEINKNLNIGIAATSTDLPGLYLKGNSTTTNFLQNPSISIGGTTNSKYYDTFLVDDPNVQYVRHWANGFDINFSVSDDRLFVVSNIDGASSVSPAGVVDGHIAFKINPETSTELRYNKVKKLETTGYGVSVYGGANVSGIATFQDNIVLTGVGKSIKIGPTNDQLSLEYDSSGLGLIRQNNNLFLLSPTITVGNLDSSKTSAAFSPAGSAELYHNNSKKLETTSTGINVTGHTETDTLNVSGISTFTSDLDINADVNVSGIATAQKFIGDGSELRGLKSTELVSYASASDISNSALSISGISTYNEVGILTNSYASLSDRFGSSVATSDDGKTIIVGATQDEVSSSNGVVYVFDREGNTFNEVGILTGSYASDNSDYFGQSVATSADGKTIVVGAYLDETGSTSDTGVVYVYDREGNNFNEVGILTGSSGADGQDRFGYSVATSADGKTIIVGADQDETSGSGSYGLVYVYDREGNNFNEVGILTGSNATHATDQFGRSVATSADGKTIVVGAIGDETSGFTGYGLVYVFDREGNNFNQVGILTGSLASDTNDRFGGSVATSADGNKIIVGAYNDEINPSITGSGIVYVFDREGNNFNQVGILTGSTNTNAYFGWSVATSADGNTIIVGGYLDSVNGSNSGVAYVFNRQGNNFNRVNTLLGSNVANGDHFGYSVAISADSKTIIVGADNDEISSSGGGNQGLVYVFDQERETYVFSDTNGNIGIGSAQPTAKLDIHGTLNVSGISTFQDDVRFPSAGASGLGNILYDKSTGEFKFNGSGADKIKSTYTYGGDSFSVYQNLADQSLIQSNSATDLYIAFNGSTYITDQSGSNKSAVFNGTGAAELYNNNSKKLETTSYGVSVTGGLNVSGVSTFQDDVNIGTGSTVAFFDISAGRVGIGTTTPTKKLDVNGTLGVSGPSVFTSNVRISPSSTNQTALSFDTELNPGGFITPGISFNMSNTSRYGIYNYYNNTDGYAYHKLASNSNFEIGLDQGSFIVGDNSAVPISSKSFEVKDDAETYLTYNKNKKLETTGYGVSVTGDVGIGSTQPTAQLNVYNPSTTGVSTQFKVQSGPTDYISFERSGTFNTFGIRSNAISLNTDGDFGVNNKDDDENYITVSGATGQVSLYHGKSTNTNHDLKLTTTSYGINVNGRVETDNLNVSGISTFLDNVRLGVGTDGSNITRTYNTDSNGDSDVLSITSVNDKHQIVQIGFSTTDGTVVSNANLQLEGKLGNNVFDYKPLIEFKKPLVFGGVGLQIGYNSGTVSHSWLNTDGSQYYSMDNDADKFVILRETPGGYPNSITNYIFEAGKTYGVKLYHDSSKKLETTGYGVTVTGGVHVSGVSTFTSDILINGLTVGRGSGNVSTNTAFGLDALSSTNSIGQFNTAVGAQALTSCTGGDRNTGIGRSALSACVDGEDNTALGYRAMHSQVSGDHNIAIGSGAMRDTVSASYSIAIGDEAMLDSTGITRCIAIGWHALDEATADDNIAIGYGAQSHNAAGGENVSLGNNTLGASNTEFNGNKNTAVGQEASQFATSCIETVAIGHRAAYDIQDANYTTAVGAYSLYNVTSGLNNTAVGNDSLRNVSTGQNNVAIGQSAGYHLEGSNNTILGAYEGFASDSTLNGTVIVSAGVTERLRITSTGLVGIGSTQPTAALDVNGSSIAINNHSIVSKTISHTSTAGISSTIDSFATSENDLAEYTIHVGYGNTIQAQKVLVMHDGTTAYSQEYAVMHNPSKIVSIDATISGSNVLLQATPETGVSGITTYKIVRGGLV